ncbi:MAG TPA: RDD family protein [Nitrospirota bacterium]|nr:RDD family protein [Nitrospirota bacterium]
MEYVPYVVEKPKYAGFWRRAVAVGIDYIIIVIFVFPFIVLIGTLAPDYIVVSAPFDLFTQKRVISTETTSEPYSDGSVARIETSIVEVATLGRWKYLYREKVKHLGNKKEETKQLIDFTTKTDVHKITTGHMDFLVIMIYWILLESSRLQASLGKRAMNLKVVDTYGRKLTILRSLGRNVSKLFSVFPTFMVGFMMAGWTNNKQALHDKMARCFVILDRH